jgi:hypothetical protein
MSAFEALSGAQRTSIGCGHSGMIEIARLGMPDDLPFVHIPDLPSAKSRSIALSKSLRLYAPLSAPLVSD